MPLSIQGQKAPNVEAVAASLIALCDWVQGQNYSGWDPYDGLSGSARKFAKNRILSTALLQANLYSPINFRPVFGIPKSVQNKALALFARAYLNLFEITGNADYRQEAEKLLETLVIKNLSEKKDEFACSSYTFTYVAPKHLLHPKIPDVICTTESVKSLLVAFDHLKGIKYLEAAKKGIRYIKNNLLFEGDEIAYIKYTPMEQGKIVINISALALETISYMLKYEFESQLVKSGEKLANFIVKFQRDDGAWPYSYYPLNKTFYWQIDYHQGFIIDGIQSFLPYLKGNGLEQKLIQSLKRGIWFYNHKQFDSEGRSCYRFPIKYPIDVHNQAQGIITFSKLYSATNELEYLKMAEKIAAWTINNMQSPEGYFYSHKYPGFANKIPYMRWGQAWMMLALSSFIKALT